MQLREIMSENPITVRPEEPVSVAARALERYNVGILPVCENGRMCGVVTDRDIVIRCLAAGKELGKTLVSDVMTHHVVSGTGDMEAAEAADLMGRNQIRRLPVVEQGKLCGMVSLGDLSQSPETSATAQCALAQISSNLSSRG